MKNELIREYLLDAKPKDIFKDKPNDMFEAVFEVDSFHPKITITQIANIEKQLYTLYFRDLETGLLSYRTQTSFAHLASYWYVLGANINHLSGVIVEIKNQYEEMVYTNSVKYELENRPEINGNKLKIYVNDQDEAYGQFDEIFIQEEYSKTINDVTVSVSKEDICVDIGANYGFFSLYAVKKGAKKVYTVEPSKSTFKHLEKNVSNFEQIIPVNIALGKFTKKRRMNFFSHHSGSSHLDDIGQPVKDGYNSEEIDCLNINDFLKKYNIDKIDFLKIDCEGAEFEIFEALDDNFLKHNIKKIIGEYHLNGDEDKRFQFLSDKIKKAGFEFSSYLFDNNLRIGYFIAYKQDSIEKKDLNIVAGAYAVGMSQVSREISDFVNFIKDKNIKNVLEIGTDRGGTFYLWCKIADKDGIKISLDYPHQMYGSADYSTENRNKKMKTWAENVHVIEGDSHQKDIFSKVQTILNTEKVDLLFIDGDHTYEGVKQDYLMYKELVKDGGYIAFHDIVDSEFHRNLNCYVSKLWGALEEEKIEFNNKENWGGIGVIQKTNNIFDNDSIFVIGAWIDSDKKRQSLIDCISKARLCYKAKILLVSHCPIDKDIVNMVDYYIYDKENPLLHLCDYDKYKDLHLLWYWHNNEYKIDRANPFRHEYAVLTSMRNAFSFAKYLGKKKIFYLEYDMIINPEEFKKEFIEPLENNDICVLDNFDRTGESLFFNIFSIKTDIGLKWTNQWDSMDDYFTKTGGKFENVEQVFNHWVTNEKCSTYYSAYKLPSFGICIIENLKYKKNGFEAFIFPCVDKSEGIYVAVITQNDKMLHGKKIFIEFLGKTNVFEVKNEKFDIFVVNIGSKNKIENIINEQIRIYDDDMDIYDKLVSDIIDESKLCNIYIKNNSDKIDIIPNFIEGPFVEIKGESLNSYIVRFIDKKDGKIVHDGNILSNHWIRASRKWFTDWKIEIEENKSIIKTIDLNFNNLRVFISFHSKSLGDSLAWIPYVEEFRKKHNCHVICSTFWNKFFKNEYRDIEFIDPGKEVSQIHAQYNIGWFSPLDLNKNPIDYRTIPLQQTASDILGLEFNEIKPKITIPDKPRNIKGKYVCIAIQSTAQAKYWNYPNGWQKITDYLNSIGYKVVYISKEKGMYMGNVPPTGIIDKSGDIPIEDRIIDLKYADMFIGIGSGLSWLSWAVNTPTILISGFSKPLCEPKDGIYRIINENVCNGCFNDKSFEFDRGNWNWCPKNKDFECSKQITPEMVIDSIKKIISDKKK